MIEIVRQWKGTDQSVAISCCCARFFPLTWGHRDGRSDHLGSLPCEQVFCSGVDLWKEIAEESVQPECHCTVTIHLPRSRPSIKLILQRGNLKQLAGYCWASVVLYLYYTSLIQTVFWSQKLGNEFFWVLSTVPFIYKLTVTLETTVGWDFICLGFDGNTFWRVCTMAN